MKKIRRKTHILLEQIRDYLAENNGGPMTAMAIKEWHAGEYGRTTPTSNAIAYMVVFHGVSIVGVKRNDTLLGGYYFRCRTVRRCFSLGMVENNIW